MKVEVVAGKTVPVLTWGQESLWWRVLRGAPRVPCPCPSSTGQPLGVLEVEVGPAQLEAVEVVTEVTVFCQLPLNYSALPFLTSALKTQKTQITFKPFLYFFASLVSIIYACLVALDSWLFTEITQIKMKKVLQHIIVMYSFVKGYHTFSCFLWILKEHKRFYHNKHNRGG